MKKDQAAFYRAPENERVYYMQRAQAYVPVSLLAGVRSSIDLASTSLKSLYAVPPALMKRFTGAIVGEGSGSGPIVAETQAHMHQMRKVLTPAEYEQLLLHVNGYVQQLVDLRLQQERATITPPQMQVIVGVIQEQLESWYRERPELSDVGVKLAALSDADVQQLAQLVQVQLASSSQWGVSDTPVQLSSAHLAQIRGLIVDHLSTTNHVQYDVLVEHLDLDALLARLLKAPALAQYVDARIDAKLDPKLAKWQLDLRAARGSGEQAQLIAQLNSEVEFVKLTLLDKQAENADLQVSISQLQSSQEDLMQRLQAHELATDTRFSGLLADIERKLATLQSEHFVLLNRHIRLQLLDLLGSKHASTSESAKMSDAELQQLVSGLFVAREYLEERLLELDNRTAGKLRDEIDRSGVVLMGDISERLRREILLAVEKQQKTQTANLKGQINAALSEEHVRSIVKSVLAIYDADKTGLVDFALESAGGQILSTRCTEAYQTKTAQLSVFGIPLWYPTTSPRVAISPNVQPGECWAFQGFPGFLVLKLNSLVYVTGFTLEHIPRSLSPNGRIDSAPRNFTVWALEHEKDYEPTQFGEYEFVDNGSSLQYFPLQNKSINRPYDIVELRIESNHGNPLYTCLYRFRVHGQPPAA